MKLIKETERPRWFGWCYIGYACIPIYGVVFGGLVGWLSGSVALGICVGILAPIKLAVVERQNGIRALPGREEDR